MVKPRRPVDDFCPTTAATRLVGQRWTLLIVHYLRAAEPGRLRFCELQARLGGLNPATLSQRLKLLERAGLVVRVETPALPPHVEYGLTRMGSELGPAVEDLTAWGRKWLAPAKTRARAKTA